MSVGTMIRRSEVESILAGSLGGKNSDYEAIAQTALDVAEKLLGNSTTPVEDLVVDVADNEQVTGHSSRFLTLLEQIRWGQDMAARLEGSQEEEGPGYLYHLPLFLPSKNIRLQWDVPLVGHIEAGATRTVRWRAWDQKTNEMTGEAILRGAPGFSMDLGKGRRVTVTGTWYAASKRESRRLIKQGDSALWELIEMWRPNLLTQMQLASSGVLHEICGSRNQTDHVGGVIDVVEAEQLVDELLLGREGEDSIFIRIAHRVAGDLRDGSGDPWVWVQRNLRSAAETAVRRLIGDPAAGRKIRRVYRELGGVGSLEDVVAAYRDAFPTEKMGKKRIVDALSAGSTAHRNSLQMSALSLQA